MLKSLRKQFVIEASEGIRGSFNSGKTLFNVDNVLPATAIHQICICLPTNNEELAMVCNLPQKFSAIIPRIIACVKKAMTEFQVTRRKRIEELVPQPQQIDLGKEVKSFNSIGQKNIVFTEEENESEELVQNDSDSDSDKPDKKKTKKNIKKIPSKDIESRNCYEEKENKTIKKKKSRLNSDKSGHDSEGESDNDREGDSESDTSKDSSTDNHLEEE